MIFPLRLLGFFALVCLATVSAADHLTPQDGAAVALLRESARAVDWCGKNGERHTQALHIARMSELLTKLRLEPSARGSGVSLEQRPSRFIGLGSPTPGHAATA